jgi:hypothetical protein
MLIVACDSMLDFSLAQTRIACQEFSLASSLMATKKKMGRPSLPRKERLGRTLGARFRTEEEREVLRAIETSGKSQAEWIRDALLTAARSAKP